MKVLLATQDFPPVEGGIAQVYADLAAGFAPGELIVSTTAAVGPGPPPPARVPIHRQPFPLARAHRLLSLRRWAGDLEALLRAERPDVLLCGNLRPLGPLCWHLNRRFGVPYYLIVHGNDVLTTHRRWSGARRLVWRAVFGRAARWVANSQAVRQLGVDQCGLNAARTAVLMPEVDTGRFQPPTPLEKAAARRAFGLPPETPLVLFVGRLVTRKGLDRLIEAAALLAHGAEVASGWRLVVAGYGDPAPYRRQARSLEIEDRVIFLGTPPAPELPRLYQAADVLAMPSRTIPERDDVEGFGVVYLEAAAAALPAVAGRSGGAPEAVIDGETGLVVDGDDPRQIAAALLRLLAEAPLRERMGRKARARVESEHAPGSLARGWRALLAADRQAGLWGRGSRA